MLVSQAFVKSFLFLVICNLKYATYYPIRVIYIELLYLCCFYHVTFIMKLKTYSLMCVIFVNAYVIFIRLSRYVTFYHNYYIITYKYINIILYFTHFRLSHYIILLSSYHITISYILSTISAI